MPATAADVPAAARRIAGQLVRTPLLPAHALSQRLGAAPFCKRERCSAPGD
jgi:threonine dehydratase